VLFCEDKESKDAQAVAVIASGEKEVILSDKLIDELGIILLKPGKGIWRFHDDPPNVMRTSVPGEYWI